MREIQATLGAGGQSLGSKAIPVAHRNDYLSVYLEGQCLAKTFLLKKGDSNKKLTEKKMWNAVDCQA